VGVTGNQQTKRDVTPLVEGNCLRSREGDSVDHSAKGKKTKGRTRRKSKQKRESEKGGKRGYNRAYGKREQTK